MYEPKMEKEMMCPIEYGLNIFGGKWKSRIICVLAANGTLRYSGIHKELNNITDAVLAAMLKEMVADGMLHRTSYNEIPPRVEYTLTEKGKSVLPIMQNICTWSRTHAEIDKENSMHTCKTCGQW